MNKKLLLLVMVMIVGMFLTACGGNNGFKEGIYDKKEMFTETVEDEFILYYYASSCVHCAKFKPVVNEYSGLENALPIYALDLDASDGDTKEMYEYFVGEKGWDLEGTPTMYHIKNGEAVNKFYGVQELKDIPLKGGK